MKIGLVLIETISLVYSRKLKEKHKPQKCGFCLALDNNIFDLCLIIEYEKLRIELELLEMHMKVCYM